MVNINVYNYNHISHAIRHIHVYIVNKSTRKKPKNKKKLIER